MTCALTTAGRIRDSILRDLGRERHVIISHPSNVIIRFTQRFNKCILLSSLSIEFLISEYKYTLAVFRSLLFSSLNILSRLRKEKEKKKKFYAHEKKSRGGTFSHTYTHSSVNLKRDVVPSRRQRKRSKLDRKGLLKPIFSPIRGRGEKNERPR